MEEMDQKTDNKLVSFTLSKGGDVFHDYEGRYLKGMDEKKDCEWSAMG